MILADFGDNFPGPNLLINELLAVVDADDEVEGGPKDDGLLLCDIEIEEERILIVGIEAEWQLALFDSFDCLGVSVNLIDAEPKLVSGVDESNLDAFDFQELVVLDGDGATDIEK